MTVFQSYIPHEPLSEFVDSFWFYESSKMAHTKERRLPNGSMQLIINLRDDELRVYDRQRYDQFQRFPGCIFSGPYSEFFVIDTTCQSSIMGVCFKPGGAFPFLPCPVDEIYNVHVSLDMLWGAEADDLRDQLLEAPTVQVKFHILEQFLLGRMTQASTWHPAIVFALKEFQTIPHTQTIADLTRSIGLSPHRFIRAFREVTGFTPKMFCRLRRFQQVLALIEQRQKVEWTSTALNCGYFDQAHFIHDFQAFSGLSPSAYLAQRHVHRNHVPLSD